MEEYVITNSTDVLKYLLLEKDKDVEVEKIKNGCIIFREVDINSGEETWLIKNPNKPNEKIIVGLITREDIQNLLSRGAIKPSSSIGVSVKIDDKVYSVYIDVEGRLVHFAKGGENNPISASEIEKVISALELAKEVWKFHLNVIN
ncbi:hypothetical protein [Methanocaldococcus sp.]|uniref:hypothetical protein n=1 Tax=Methanocaldococcus sp. TaxID=2152917 RepID=UPI00263615BA|nr:hypothetical protein [Methanocaldococcus sp.]MCQ6254230.1 hypothetical protein [Methanocaldococcus sp.]